MIVSPASRIVRAISFGVFCRSAPSTRAIIRSRNVSPGLAVMRTTISSDSTRVPPVTAERSPPDSRITGADSPVIADSSTVAMPSTTSPSPGITSPAVTTHRSPICSCDDGTSTSRAVAADVGDGLAARLAQRRRLGLAAPLGHRLGEVGEQHGEPQEHHDEAGEQVLLAGGVAEVADEQDRGQHRADLDDEHHRVRASVRGSSLTNESSAARLTIAGSNSDRDAGGRLRTFGGRSVGVGAGVGSGVRVVVMSS